MAERIVRLRPNGKRRIRFPSRQAGVPDSKDIPAVRADRAAGGRLHPEGPTEAGRPVASGARSGPTLWSKPHRSARSGEDLARKRPGRSLFRPRDLRHEWDFAGDAAVAGSND